MPATSIRRALSHNRRLIVAVTAVSVLAAALFSVARESTYTATARLKFSIPDAQQILSQGGFRASTFEAPAEVAAADAGYVTSLEVVKAVQRRLDTSLSAGELRVAVHTQVELGNNLVAVEATAAEASEAADLANAFARETAAVLTERDRALFRRAANDIPGRIHAVRVANGGELPKTAIQIFASQIARYDALARSTRPVQVVNEATVPTTPDQTAVATSAALGLILGLLLGSLAALVREYLRSGSAPERVTVQRRHGGGKSNPTTTRPATRRSRGD